MKNNVYNFLVNLLFLFLVAHKILDKKTDSEKTEPSFIVTNFNETSMI